MQLEAKYEVDIDASRVSTLYDLTRMYLRVLQA